MRTPRLHLPQLTLCCVDNLYPLLGFEAVQKTCANLSFAEVLFFTSTDFVLPTHTVDNLRVVTHEVIRNLEDYSRFMIKNLQAYVKTSHVLTIQWDGYVIQPNSWKEQFLNYDYIGAPWPRKSGLWVGNGGFSLRSIKLLTALKEEAIVPTHPEDACICDQHREYLEVACRLRFAPTDIAQSFSFEFIKPHDHVFGFHGMSNFPRVMPTDELLKFIQTMPDALIFNGYFRLFVVNLVKLTPHQLKLELVKKTMAVMATADAQRWISEEVHELIKTFVKARCLDLARGLLVSRTFHQGWSWRNIKLAVRIFLAIFYIR